MTVNVLKFWDDGATGRWELVEKADRKAEPVREAEKRGMRGLHRGKYRVSYKGKRYVTFSLPSVYGELAGQCICIARRKK